MTRFNLSLFILFFSILSPKIWACTFNSDCDNGYFCNSQTKKCTMGRWPDGGCSFDSDCLSGYVCQNSSCVEKGGNDFECTFDSDCDNGYYCNSATRECVMGRWPDGGCSFDSDCLSGYVCQNSSCVEKGGNDFECTFDSDCDNGYHCNSATRECVMGRWPDGGCSFDSDCLEGYECEAGECQSRGNAKPNKIKSQLVKIKQNKFSSFSHFFINAKILKNTDKENCSF